MLHVLPEVEVAHSEYPHRKIRVTNSPCPCGPKTCLANNPISKPSLFKLTPTKKIINPEKPILVSRI